LATIYAAQTKRKHGITIDIPASSLIIEEALEIVNETFPAFWDESLKRVKASLE
jgi:hypothetical protein